MEIQSPAARDEPRQSLGIPLSKVGFPIRKSADQSFFAAPRGLSQRSTSFIASQRQGIHRMPLRHLIALILDTHSSQDVFGKRFAKSWIRLRKTSLLSRSTRRRAVKLANMGCRIVLRLAP